jgi:hypothetical protein
VNESTLPGALGYHFINAAEVPFGFVFVLDPNSNEWTITLSHEALEMIIDPTANVLVPGAIGIGPRDVFDFNANATTMIKVMVRVENGIQPYADIQFDAATRLV